MPIRLLNINKPDAFVCNEDTVNQLVYEYLTKKGFKCDAPLRGRQRGIDVTGTKNGWTMIVESKGSQSNFTKQADLVFDNSQLWDHLCKQIGQLIKLRQKHGTDRKLYVMANPKIERILKKVEQVRLGVNELQFVLFWITEEGEIEIDCEDKILRSALSELDIR